MTNVQENAVEVDKENLNVIAIILQDVPKTRL